MPVWSHVQLKRVYDPPAADDGLRVLVDRLWPRGLKREEARIDLWLKEVAPSDALRKWFGHDPTRWEEFQRRYRAELTVGEQRQALERLQAEARRGLVTLLFGAKDTTHNNAVALAEVLEEER